MPWGKGQVVEEVSAEDKYKEAVIQLIECRTRQMPDPCVTSPQRTIRSAFCPGVMRCSQIPETTNPMAKPDNPDVSPPMNAAMRKSPSNVKSIFLSHFRSGTKQRLAASS